MKPAVVGWCLAAAVACAARVNAADPAPTMEDVKKAWAARQDAHASFRAEWTETVKEKAGWRVASASRANPGPHPPADAEHAVACSFAADGKRSAATWEGPVYGPENRAWAPVARATVSDGVVSKTTNSLSQPGWVRASVESGTGQFPTCLMLRENVPLLNVYRPLGGGAVPAFGVEKFELSGRGEKIRGADCVEVILKDAPKNAVPDSGYRLWCDPGRGFLPVRSRQRLEGNSHDLDWTYRKDDQGRWVMAGWSSPRIVDSV